MARPLRLELADGLYHVTSRGDRREDIYTDDEDREKWLEILGNVCSRFNWRCHAYCQMDNHYHIVIETAEANLSKWGDLQNQIFLGTEKFVNKKQSLINKKESLGEVPRLHKRKIPKSLEYYERKYKNQKLAIYKAYLSGGYTLKEIGDYFQKHYSTISRRVKDNE